MCKPKYSSGTTGTGGVAITPVVTVGITTGVGATGVVATGVVATGVVATGVVTTDVVTIGVAAIGVAASGVAASGVAASGVVTTDVVETFGLGVSAGELPVCDVPAVIGVLGVGEGVELFGAGLGGTTGS